MVKKDLKKYGGTVYANSGYKYIVEKVDVNNNVVDLMILLTEY